MHASMCNRLALAGKQHNQRFTSGKPPDVIGTKLVTGKNCDRRQRPLWQILRSLNGVQPPGAVTTSVHRWG
jgi:hypothetical protein